MVIMMDSDSSSRKSMNIMDGKKKKMENKPTINNEQRCDACTVYTAVAFTVYFKVTHTHTKH